MDSFVQRAGGRGPMHSDVSALPGRAVILEAARRLRSQGWRR